MDNPQFHQDFINQQMTKEIIKGNLYTQHMSDTNNNSFVSTSVQSGYGSGLTDNIQYEKKIYKGQLLAIAISLCIGWGALFLIAYFFM